MKIANIIIIILLYILNLINIIYNYLKYQKNQIIILYIMEQKYVISYVINILLKNDYIWLFKYLYYKLKIDFFLLYILCFVLI